MNSESLFFILARAESPFTEQNRFFYVQHQSLSFRHKVFSVNSRHLDISLEDFRAQITYIKEKSTL